MSLADDYRREGGWPRDTGAHARGLLRFLLRGWFRKPTSAKPRQDGSPPVQVQHRRSEPAPVRALGSVVHINERKYYPPQRDAAVEQASLAREMYRL